MDILSLESKEFKKYGKVIEGYDFTELLDVLRNETEKPDDHVIYFPGNDALEATAVAKEIETNIYGGMPIQIGFCNGTNSKLNCLEYHRDTEINIADDDMVLMLATMSDLEDDYTMDTSKVKAFAVPKGVAVQVYETTLHYAPARKEGGFRVIVVLPKGTNTEKPEIEIKNQEDRMMTACNKWLIAHPDTAEAASGAFVGLKGKNLDLAE